MIHCFEPPPRPLQRNSSAGRVMTWVLWVLALLSASIGYFAVQSGIPRGAAGMAAKGVCSAAFVAGRKVDRLMEEDVLPASQVLKLVSVEIDEKEKRVTGKFAGLFTRVAVWLPSRGCVLDVAGTQVATDSIDYGVRNREPRPWPEGNGLSPKEKWPPGVNEDLLKTVVDHAFVGAGDPRAANTRAMAIIHKGQLIVSRAASGFALETQLHGWSMAKSVTGMLFHKLSSEQGLPINTPVVNAFPLGREPAWVAAWRLDARKAIRVSDLVYMRDGLANAESYEPGGAVPRMLWNETNTANFAAQAAAEASPGSRWRYLSQTTNLLSAVARGRLPTDGEYWNYPQRQLFWPIGANSAVMETDASGNWVGSSYVWASVGDWARLGLLLMQDGKWQDREIFPPGWLTRAKTPSTSGEGAGYGAQVWLYGNPLEGRCKGQVPEDTLAMGGHWGQIVAMVPSRETVIVRLGWTFKSGQFDPCKLIADVLRTLPH
jgi:CubicO group peptidase (beta-lactamase class C family)